MDRRTNPSLSITQHDSHTRTRCARARAHTYKHTHTFTPNLGYLQFTVDSQISSPNSAFCRVKSRCKKTGEKNKLNVRRFISSWSGRRSPCCTVRPSSLPKRSPAAVAIVFRTSDASRMANSLPSASPSRALDCRRRLRNSGLV